MASDLVEELRKQKAAKAVVKTDTGGFLRKPPEADKVAVANDSPVSVPLLSPDAPSRTTPVMTLESKSEVLKSKKKVKVEGATEISVSNDTTIYVGCMPLGRSLPLFKDWVGPIEDEVAKQNQVAHFNLIEYHAIGVLAAALKKRLDTLPKEIVLMGNEPSAGVFLSLLQNVNIVKGF